MLYAITFLCLGNIACPMTPEMSRYEHLWVFNTLEDCKSASSLIPLSGEATVGCVGQDSIIKWTNPPLESYYDKNH